MMSGVHIVVGTVDVAMFDNVAPLTMMVMMRHKWH
jgi:hypothetical protein